MLTIHDVLETNQMIQKNNLDVRTITMGISLLDCCSSDGKVLCRNIYDKITSYGENLVKTGEDIAREYGVPIINKRVAVTPISLVAGASDLTNYVETDEICALTQNCSYYEFAEKLVSRAIENGGGDNVTVVTLAY